MTVARAALALFALCGVAAAHDGPPYAILVDQPLGTALLSVWADPDVGTGSFFFYVEREREPVFPDGLRISLSAHPIDDPELVRESEAVLPREGEPFQLFGELPFDFRGTWRTRISWKTDDLEGERTLDLNVTPPGFGPIDILWYLFPFLGVGFLWAKALLRRRASREPSVARRPAPQSPSADPLRTVDPASPDPKRSR